MIGLLILIFGGVGAFIWYLVASAASTTAVATITTVHALKQEHGAEARAARSAAHKRRLAQARRNILGKFPNYGSTLEGMREDEIIDMGESLPHHDPYA